MSKTRPEHLKRRYYLHRAVKAFAQVHAYKKQIIIEQSKEEYITPRQLRNLNELKATYGYQVQYAVPGSSLKVKNRISKRILIKLERTGPMIVCREPGAAIVTTTSIQLSRGEAKAFRDILIHHLA